MLKKNWLPHLKYIFKYIFSKTDRPEIAVVDCPRFFMLAPDGNKNRDALEDTDGNWIEVTEKPNIKHIERMYRDYAQLGRVLKELDPERFNKYNMRK